ncbi:transcriptional regulator [Streptomyces sp. NBC_01304]|uniref:transcriptional regulator n=1 Tax=Streptomyces sp. NBC_01304 TaxID=2903818 RepID=UPI002E128487|nr:transcriptional regulator [Streptomyces sp. NBC_01304]
MAVDVAVLIKEAQAQLAEQAVPNRFLDRLEAGRVPRAQLRALAGELYRLVRSDRRSFALLAARFPDAPAGDLFLAMAQGEGEALRLLLDFAAELEMEEWELAAYEPKPLAQAYPAYLTQTSLYGSRSDIALALLANVEESGAHYARVADALRSGYGFDEAAVGHFRFFADTPPELLDQATATLAAGLAAGDDPVEAVRTARLVHAYENAFWGALAEDAPAH